MATSKQILKSILVYHKIDLYLEHRETYGKLYIYISVSTKLKCRYIFASMNMSGTLSKSKMAMSIHNIHHKTCIHIFLYMNFRHLSHKRDSDGLWVFIIDYS